MCIMHLILQCKLWKEDADRTERRKIRLTGLKADVAFGKLRSICFDQEAYSG